MTPKQQQAVQVIIEGLILIGLLYLAFFKSYFTEKGKQLATQEHVQNLTKLVEDVKSNQQFSLQAKLSLRNAEHDSLIDYFSKYSLWLTEIENCPIADVTEHNVTSLKEMRDNMDAAHNAFVLAHGTMSLFVENETIAALHRELIVETLRMQHHAQTFLLQVERIMIMKKHIDTTYPPEQRVEQHRLALEDVKTRYRQFLEERLPTFATVNRLAVSQRRAISAHLKALVTLPE
jgi:hypothetical protein